MWHVRKFNCSIICLCAALDNVNYFESTIKIWTVYDYLVCVHALLAEHKDKPFYELSCWLFIEWICIFVSLPIDCLLKARAVGMFVRAQLNFSSFVGFPHCVTAVF